MSTVHENTAAIKTLNEQLVAMGGHVAGQRKRVDLIATSWQRFSNEVQNAVPLLSSIRPAIDWIGSLSKVATVFSDDTDEMAAATSNLTIAQRRLILPLISASKYTDAAGKEHLKGAIAAKIGFKANEIFRDMAISSTGAVRGWVLALMKLSSIFFTIVSIVGIVVFAFSMLSLATQGINSPVIEFAEQYAPWLVESLKGIVEIIQGDITLSMRHLKSIFLVFGAAMLVLPATLAPLFVAILIGIGLYKKFKESGDTWQVAAKKAALGVLASLLVLLNSKAIVMGIAKLVWWALKFLGIGRVLVLAGLALLWASATGQIEGAMGDWAAVVGAGMVFLGLIILKWMGVIGATILGLPLFWVAALLLVIVLLVRHHKAIIAKFKSLGGELKKWAKGVGRDIADAIIQPLQDSFDWIMEHIPGGTPTGGPMEAMASGGPVRSGRTYLVGERGPELFSPKSSGNIVPNDKIGGGVTNNITLSIDVGGVTDHTDKRALARQISDELNKELRRLGGSPTRGRY